MEFYGNINFLSGRSFMEYIRITKENIDLEHICCAMSGKQSLAKKEWIGKSAHTTLSSVIESIAVNFDLSPASLFLFFYIRYCKFDCFIGADCLAVAAAYTVHAVGIPPDGNV